MNLIELVLLLLMVAVALVLAAEHLRIAYPILLVLGGLALAFVPGLPEMNIAPEVVFLVFLPPVLFSAAWFTSWREFTYNLRPIALLAVGLVLATAFGIAAVAHAVIPGMPWSVAFVLGAIVSPPDAVAATALAQRLRVPRRIVTILEGESLVNDATGIIAFRVGLAAVALGSFSLVDAALEFVFVSVCGVALGLAVGWVFAQIHKRMENFLIEISMTLLTPYVAYIPAEHLGVSGVLATVAAGGYLGWRNPELLSPLTRFRGRGVWSVFLLLLNGLVFILIGLHLAAVRKIELGVSLGSLAFYAAAVSGAAIVLRLIYVPLAAYLPRLLSRRLRERDPYPPWQAVAVISWAGMRGIVSLAVALSIPHALPDGRAFPHRDLVIVLSFSVILATLLLNGLTLPVLIRWLRVHGDDSEAREERLGLLRATEAALAKLEEIDRTTVLNPALIARARLPYEERLDRLTRSSREDPECRLTEGEAQAYRRLKHAALAAERRALVALRRSGEIGEDVFHRLQEAIDLEALQPDR